VLVTCIEWNEGFEMARLGKRTSREKETYTFFKCVFPGEVSEDERLLLMYVLYDIGDMSMRAVADAAGILMDVDYVFYLNDMYYVASSTYDIDQAKSSSLRERLYACGYDTWINS
jgi:hypothetical protein